MATKTCHICSTEFYNKRGNAKYCSKQCKQKAQRENENRWRSTEKGSATLHAGNLKRRYGLSSEEYWTLVEVQHGKCAICKRHDCGRKGSKRLYVDHDHITGRVRGLLCQLCNQLLGCASDNVSILRSAITYLEI